MVYYQSFNGRWKYPGVFTGSRYAPFFFDSILRSGDHGLIMEGLFQLIYVSSSRDVFTENSFEVMLEKARVRNSRQQVTGMLIENSGTVMQVLEGRETDVQDIYRDIQMDPRHDNIVMLLKHSVKERGYASWEMGRVRWDGRTSPPTDPSDDIFPDGLSPQQIVSDRDKSIQMLMAFSNLELR